MAINLSPYKHKYIYSAILLGCALFYAVYFREFFVEQYMRFRLRNTHIVVSMSTTPYRIAKLDRVLQSIIKQNVAIDNIYLNVPYIFNRDNLQYNIPSALEANKHVTILRTEDYGPATKLLGLLSKERLPDGTIIVTLDDDIIYPKNVVLHLAYASLNNQNSAVGLSGVDIIGSYDVVTKRDQSLGFKNKYAYSGPVTILQSYAGIAYKAEFFKPDVFDIVNMPMTCINSDDVFFSFYLAQHNIGRIAVSNKFMSMSKITPDTEAALSSDALQMQNSAPAAKHAQCLTYLKTNYPKVDFSNSIKPNILVIALPKSGSTYLTTMLADNLGYQQLSLFYKYDRRERSIKSNIMEYRKKDAVVFKEHFSAPIKASGREYINVLVPLDVDALRVNNQKIVLHMRDPRQVLLSLYWHIDKNRHGEFIPFALQHWYFVQPQAVQLDWAIDNLLPIIVTWMQDWIDFKQQEDTIVNGLPILITTYDELIADRSALYAKILSFYGMERNFYVIQAPVKDRKVRFRKGDPEEWRSAFSTSQKQHMAKLIPVGLLEKFGWPVD